MIAPGPVDGDHYRCWEASDPTGGALNVPVTLIDQFQSIDTIVMEPWRLCNPADKNGEGIQDPNSHLTCYKIQPIGQPLGFQVPVSNQFFSLANIDINEAFAVCVPSAKMVPEPGVMISLVCGAAMLAGLDRRRRQRDD